MGSAGIFSLVLLVANPSPPSDPSPSLLETYRALTSAVGSDPEARVRLALWCEANGLKDEGLEHLRRAVGYEPAHPKARGLLGLVAYRGGWLRPEEVGDRVRTDSALATASEDYRTRRAETPDTAEAHRELALWCERRGLEAEAKAHWIRVTWLAPHRSDAWTRLGYARHSGRWMTEAQIVAERAEAQAQARADRVWHPRLAQWRQWLRQPDREQEARNALARVGDPRAVPSVCRVFGRPEDSGWAHAWAVYVLGRIDAPAATNALAELAASTRSDRVRHMAAERLATRDPRASVGLLINRLRDPVRYEVRPVGGLDSPGVLSVEGQRAVVQTLYTPRIGSENWQRSPGDRVRADRLGRDVLVQESGRTTLSGGRGGRTPGGALTPDRAGAGDTLEAVEAAQQEMDRDLEPIRRAKNAVDLANSRILEVLHRVTGMDLGPSRLAWTAWWTSEIGYKYQAPPTTSQPTIVQSVTVTLLPRPRPVLVPLSHSCFAAGTLVRTIRSLEPIETLQVGDQALSLDAKTGSVSFQPIVGVFHNPPARTVRVSLGDETIVATGIHRFWRAGRGWTMARDLRPGDAIRTRAGLARVHAVTAGAIQPVYNLEVAEGRSFFVGQQGALVHDNTLAEPTPQPFDAVPSLEAVTGRNNPVLPGR